MGGSESQPKANRGARTTEGHHHAGNRRSSRNQQQLSGTPQSSPATSSATASPSQQGGSSPSPGGGGRGNAQQQNNRRPSLDELLGKVREGVATTHAMLSGLPQQGEGQAQIRAELERRLYVLLSYEERLLMAQQQENAELSGGTVQTSGAKPEKKKKRLHPAVSQCPRIKYTEEHAQSEEEEKRQCSICWVDYEVGETVLILPCLHWVHDACGEDWLQRKPQCPICQLDIIQSLRNCASYQDQ